MKHTALLVGQQHLQLLQEAGGVEIRAEGG